MTILQHSIPKGYHIKKGIYWGKMSLSYAYLERKRLMSFRNIKDNDKFKILIHKDKRAEILEKD